MEVELLGPVRDFEEKNFPLHWEGKLSPALEARNKPCKYTRKTSHCHKMAAVVGGSGPNGQDQGACGLQIQKLCVQSWLHISSPRLYYELFESRSCFICP